MPTEPKTVQHEESRENEPLTDPQVKNQSETTETEPAIGKQPETETDPPDVRGFRFVQIASKTIVKKLIQGDLPLLFFSVLLHCHFDLFVTNPH